MKSYGGIGTYVRLGPTTQLYNRVQDEISLDEIERVHI